jgi:hypothetical protein
MGCEGEEGVAMNMKVGWWGKAASQAEGWKEERERTQWNWESWDWRWLEWEMGIEGKSMLSLPRSTLIHADLPVENAYPASTAFPPCLHSPVFSLGLNRQSLQISFFPIFIFPIPFIAISSSCRSKWRCVYNKQPMALFQSEMRTLHSSALHSVLLSYKPLAEEEEREIRPTLLILILFSVQWHNTYAATSKYHISIYQFIPSISCFNQSFLSEHRKCWTTSPSFRLSFWFRVSPQKKHFLLYKKAMCARRFVRADSLQNGQNWRETKQQSCCLWI